MTPAHLPKESRMATIPVIDALDRCKVALQYVAEMQSNSPDRSSRAQARTTVGREFPISALSMAERGPSPTIAHVSCALSKIPYGGFSPVRLQAEVSR